MFIAFRIIIFAIAIILGSCVPASAFVGTVVAAIASYVAEAAFGAAIASGIGAVGVYSAIGAAANLAAFSFLTSAITGSESGPSPIGSTSPTYADSLPQATMTKGTPIPKGRGLCRIPGNIIRPNDVKDETYIKCIVGWCQGEVDEYLGFFVNDVEWTDFNNSHVKWSHSGSETQSGITNIFDDDESCNYRGLAVTEFRFIKAEEISSLNNVNAVIRLQKCLEIGEDEGGTESWTCNNAQILWDFYIREKGYTSASLWENDFLALEEYCANVDSDSYSCIVRPAIVGDDTIKTTTEWAENPASGKFAFRVGKSLTGGAANNSFIANDNENQRINVDMGRDDLVLVGLIIENYHDSGSNTNYGMNNFVVQGSNTSSDLDHTTYSDSGSSWANVKTGLTATEHTGSDQADPQTISIANSTAYRYLSFKIADNHGDSTYLGVRNIKMLFLTPRYTFNMIFDTKMNINDAEKIIWKSFNGRVIRSQGKFKPVWEAAEEHDGSGSLQTKTVKHTFTKSNIIEKSLEWKPISYPNMVRIYYKNSADQFRTASVEMRDDRDIAIRGEVSLEENCWWITDAAQASRRCQKLFNRRYVKRGAWLTGFPISQKLEVYDRVAITHDLVGWSGKDFLILKKTEDWKGRPKFYVVEYLSGIYQDNGFETQEGYLVQTANPNLPPSSTASVTAIFNAVGSDSYSFGSITITFTKPVTPHYSHTIAYVSVDDSDYYEAGAISRGEPIYVNGLGVYYAPGDTVYVKLKHVNINGVSSAMPATADTTVDIPDSVAIARFANFFFGIYDFWGGNADIDNAATTIVVGGLDATAKIALGASANAMTGTNMGTYPGFYADGDGHFRVGGPGYGMMYNVDDDILYVTPKARVGSGDKYIDIDGENTRIVSSDYVTGYMGSGFLISPDLIEANNAMIRGMIRTSVFQKDTISVVGGNLLIRPGDVLAEDMPSDS